jgi:hypothetical protein
MPEHAFCSARAVFPRGPRVAGGERLRVGELPAVERSPREDWDLVVIEPSLDFSTCAGRAMAGMLAVFAEFERSVISERTKGALAAARERGTKRLSYGISPCVCTTRVRTGGNSAPSCRRDNEGGNKLGGGEP